MFLAPLDLLRPGHLAWLDDTELDRRDQYRRGADRDRFALAAALLRAVASRHTRTDPAAVVVDRTCTDCGKAHGRPTLPGTMLQVSISHSGELAAAAATTAAPVGVDIEAVGSCDYAALVASVCAPDERALVRDADDFYAFWTRKEAVLKATGEGLRRPMTSVVVTAPGEPPALIALGSRHQVPPPCWMADLVGLDGYRGAVAVLTAEPMVLTQVDPLELLRL